MPSPNFSDFDQRAKTIESLMGFFDVLKKELPLVSNTTSVLQSARNTIILNTQEFEYALAHLNRLHQKIATLPENEKNADALNVLIEEFKLIYSKIDKTLQVKKEYVASNKAQQNASNREEDDPHFMAFYKAYAYQYRIFVPKNAYETDETLKSLQIYEQTYQEQFHRYYAKALGIETVSGQLQTLSQDISEATEKKLESMKSTLEDTIQQFQKMLSSEKPKTGLFSMGKQAEEKLAQQQEVTKLQRESSSKLDEIALLKQVNIFHQRIMTSHNQVCDRIQLLNSLHGKLSSLKAENAKLTQALKEARKEIKALNIAGAEKLFKFEVAVLEDDSGDDFEKKYGAQIAHETHINEALHNTIKNINAQKEKLKALATQLKEAQTEQETLQGTLEEIVRSLKKTYEIDTEEQLHFSVAKIGACNSTNTQDFERHLEASKQQNLALTEKINDTKRLKQNLEQWSEELSSLKAKNQDLRTNLQGLEGRLRKFDLNRDDVHDLFVFPDDKRKAYHGLDASKYDSLKREYNLENRQLEERIQKIQDLEQALKPLNDCTEERVEFLLTEVGKEHQKATGAKEAQAKIGAKISDKWKTFHAEVHRNHYTQGPVHNKLEKAIQPISLKEHVVAMGKAVGKGGAVAATAVGVGAVLPKVSLTTAGIMGAFAGVTTAFSDYAAWNTTQSQASSYEQLKEQFSENLQELGIDLTLYKQCSEDIFKGLLKNILFRDFLMKEGKFHDSFFLRREHGRILKKLRANCDMNENDASQDTRVLRESSEQLFLLWAEQLLDSITTSFEPAAQTKGLAGLAQQGIDAAKDLFSFNLEKEQMGKRALKLYMLDLFMGVIDGAMRETINQPRISPTLFGFITGTIVGGLIVGGMLLFAATTPIGWLAACAGIGFLVAGMIGRLIAMKSKCLQAPVPKRSEQNRAGLQALLGTLEAKRAEHAKLINLGKKVTAENYQEIKAQKAKHSGVLGGRFDWLVDAIRRPKDTVLLGSGWLREYGSLYEDNKLVLVRLRPDMKALIQKSLNQSKDLYVLLCGALDNDGGSYTKLKEYIDNTKRYLQENIDKKIDDSNLRNKMKAQILDLVASISPVNTKPLPAYLREFYVKVLGGKDQDLEIVRKMAYVAEREDKALPSETPQREIEANMLETAEAKRQGPSLEEKSQPSTRSVLEQKPGNQALGINQKLEDVAASLEGKLRNQAILMGPDKYRTILDLRPRELHLESPEAKHDGINALLENSFTFLETLDKTKKALDVSFPGFEEEEVHCDEAVLYKAFLLTHMAQLVDFDDTSVTEDTKAAIMAFAEAKFAPEDPKKIFRQLKAQASLSSVERNSPYQQVAEAVRLVMTFDVQFTFRKQLEKLYEANEFFRENKSNICLFNDMKKFFLVAGDDVYRAEVVHLIKKTEAFIQDMGTNPQVSKSLKCIYTADVLKNMDELRGKVQTKITKTEERLARCCSEHAEEKSEDRKQIEQELESLQGTLALINTHRKTLALEIIIEAVDAVPTGQEKFKLKPLQKKELIDGLKGALMGDKEVAFSKNYISHLSYTGIFKSKVTALLGVLNFKGDALPSFTEASTETPASNAFNFSSFSNFQ